MRKTHNKDFKFKVALEAIRSDLKIVQIVSKYQVAESLVYKWKKQLIAIEDRTLSILKRDANSHPKHGAMLCIAEVLSDQHCGIGK